MFVSSGIAIGGKRLWSGGTCPEPWVDTRFPDADLSIDAPVGHHKSVAPQRGRGAAQHLNLNHGGYGRRLSRPGVNGARAEVGRSIPHDRTINPAGGSTATRPLLSIHDLQLTRKLILLAIVLAVLIE